MRDGAATPDAPTESVTPLGMTLFGCILGSVAAFAWWTSSRAPLVLTVSLLAAGAAGILTIVIFLLRRPPEQEPTTTQPADPVCPSQARDDRPAVLAYAVPPHPRIADRAVIVADRAMARFFVGIVVGVLAAAVAFAAHAMLMLVLMAFVSAVLAAVPGRRAFAAGLLFSLPVSFLVLGALVIA